MEPNTPQKKLNPVKRLQKALLQEVAETKEVAQLLKRRAKGQPISTEESQRMEEQLTDLSKLLPVITVLLLPFGAFLVVLLDRILPISLIPSAFRSLLPGGKTSKKPDS